MSQKYTLDRSETRRIGAITVYRIVYNSGAKGGWLENERNLSQDGSCGVYRDAVVCGHARVYQDAIVSENAFVRDNASVCGRACVFGHATIMGTAEILGHSCVKGFTKVGSETTVYGSASLSVGCYVGAGNVTEAKKYWLDKNETQNYYGSKVYRIRYTDGSSGGWLESEDNLSQSGICRVCNEAVVRNNAKVLGNAVVKDNASVHDNAEISGNAKVIGYAEVYGRAVVKDNAIVGAISSTKPEKRNCLVCGDAEISGNANVLCGWVLNNVKVTGHAVVDGEREYNVKDSVINGNEKSTEVVSGLKELPPEKYVLDPDDSKIVDGVTVYRIVYKNGWKGGWLESEKNLSQFGDCRVFNDAVVLGDAKVKDGATVMDRAKVTGRATVCGKAIVGSSARILGDSVVTGYARILGHAIVQRNARVYGNAIVTDMAIVSDNAIVTGSTRVDKQMIVGGSESAVDAARAVEATRLNREEVDSGNTNPTPNKEEDVSSTPHVPAGKKYVLKPTNFTHHDSGKQLFRVIYADGDQGGLVTGEHNLSHDGSCRILDQAIVADTAFVSGNAEVSGSAVVEGNAHIFGEAAVFADARVNGRSEVYDKARVYGRAQVTGHSIVNNAAHVREEAFVCDGHIFGKAFIEGRARVVTGSSVSGDAIVKDNVVLTTCSVSDDVALTGDFAAKNRHFDARSFKNNGKTATSDAVIAAIQKHLSEHRILEQQAINSALNKEDHQSVSAVSTTTSQGEEMSSQTSALSKLANKFDWVRSVESSIHDATSDVVKNLGFGIAAFICLPIFAVNYARQKKVGAILGGRRFSGKAKAAGFAAANIGAVYTTLAVWLPQVNEALRWIF